MSRNSKTDLRSISRAPESADLGSRDMFHVPEAKRVKRSHFIRSSSYTESSHSPSGYEGDCHSQADQNVLPDYVFEYDFIDVTQLATAVAKDQHAAQPKEPTGDDKQTFEFCLFASTDNPTTTTSIPTASTTAITILPSQDSSSIPLSEGRFLKPNRPSAYYFTSALPSAKLHELRQQFTSSAVSSTTVIEKATFQQWPGTALPWRVLHLSASPPTSKANPKASSTPTGSAPPAPASTSNSLILSDALSLPLPVTSHVSTHRHTKPSKKRRIQLRTRLIHRIQFSTAVKEATQKEKRAAANRKNKLKRRERNRRKKMEAASSEGKAETGTGVTGPGEVGEARSGVDEGKKEQRNG